MNKMNKSSLIITMILTLVIGILFVLFPKDIINLLGYIVGTVLIVLGVLNILMYFKTSPEEGMSFGFSIGLILIVLGSYLMIKTNFILSTLSVFFGFFIMINGIFSLQVAVDSLRAKTNKWKAIIIMAIINTLLGIIILYNPFAGTEALVMYIGIFMIVVSVLNFITFIISEKMKKPKLEL